MTADTPRSVPGGRTATLRTASRMSSAIRLYRLFGMYGLVWSQVASDLLTVLASYLLLHRDMRGWS